VSYVFDAGSKDYLISERRMKRQPYHEILGRASPRKGELWADLGCGIGYFTIPLAEMGAMTLALDGQREMVDTLLSRVPLELRGSICPMVSRLPSIPLADGSVDRMLMVNVLHEVPDITTLAEEVVRVLRHGGTLTLVDFQKIHEEMGPPFEERIPPDEAVAVFAGMEVEARWESEVYYQLELRLP
jgi:ubiquinone/menaquinone biosynthesis C-methylase UbiE